LKGTVTALGSPPAAQGPCTRDVTRSFVARVGALCAGEAEPVSDGDAEGETTAGPPSAAKPGRRPRKSSHEGRPAAAGGALLAGDIEAVDADWCVQCAPVCTAAFTPGGVVFVPSPGAPFV
jgi:hypothetical protein